MQRFWLNTTLLLSVCVPILAGDLPPVTTGGLANGRAWAIFDTTAKVAFLTGFGDALGACSTTMVPHYSAAKLSRGEVSALVDDFYKDAANIRIPIMFALDLVSNRASGEKLEDYQRDVESDRKIAASLP